MRENPIEVFNLEASDYEMGLKQGKRFQRQINKLYKELTDSDEFLTSKPFLVPKFLYRKIANLVSSKMIKDPIRTYFPSQWTFLKGLSRGSGLSLEKLLFMQAIDALGTQITNYKLEKENSITFNNCSAVGINSERSFTGKPLIIKNWDGPEFLANYTVFRNIKSSNMGRYNTLGSGVVGLIGINNGMNDKGLSIVYNYAYPLDIGKKGVPPMIIIRNALENCDSVEETIKLFKKYPRIGGANIMVADKTGDLVVLETSPSKIEVRREGSDGEKSYLICTNHYVSHQMKELEIPRSAVYDESASKAWQGKKVYESSILRYKDAEDNLKNAPDKISLEFLNKRIQCSHGSENIPSGNTVCNHGIETSTGFGVVIDVKNEAFYAAIGKPCEENMQNLSKK
jgi:predicted choloylglycine hydrolase